MNKCVKVLIAPDSFKGSASSLEVAKALAVGLKNSGLEFSCQLFPLADGGEGTVDTLLATTSAKKHVTEVKNPLGEKSEAVWAYQEQQRLAIIEMASASGLTLVPLEKRNPLISSTYGTGQLIKAALDSGAKTILLGIGGSATNDGGVGLAQALGYRFFDSDGKLLTTIPLQLERLQRIDCQHVDRRLKNCRLRIACDVSNPLLGEQGASSIYAPQKGADKTMVKQLERLLERLLVVCKSDVTVKAEKIASSAGAGAAGGLGFGLQVFTGAQLETGVKLILELSGFHQALKECDILLSGEGRTDGQSSYGKLLSGLAEEAKQLAKPFIVFSGSLTNDADVLLGKGVTAIFSIIDRPMSLQEAMKNTLPLLSSASLRAAQLLANLKN